MPRAHNHPRDAQAVHDAIHAIVAKIMRPLVRLPRAKFQHEAVSGIVRQRTLVQRDIARAFNETSKAPGTVERRLTAHLNDPGLAGSINAGLLSHGAPPLFRLRTALSPLGSHPAVRAPAQAAHRGHAGRHVSC